MPKFNYVVCSIDELKHLDTLSIYEMQGSLLVYEKKVIQQEKEEQDLKASTNNNAWLPSRSAYRGWDWGRRRGDRENRYGGRQ